MMGVSGLDLVEKFLDEELKDIQDWDERYDAAHTGVRTTREKALSTETRAGGSRCLEMKERESGKDLLMEKDKFDRQRDKNGKLMPIDFTGDGGKNARG